MVQVFSQGLGLELGLGLGLGQGLGLGLELGLGLGLGVERARTISVNHLLHHIRTTSRKKSSTERQKVTYGGRH